MIWIKFGRLVIQGLAREGARRLSTADTGLLHESVSVAAGVMASNGPIGRWFTRGQSRLKPPSIATFSPLACAPHCCGCRLRLPDRARQPASIGV